MTAADRRPVPVRWVEKFFATIAILAVVTIAVTMTADVIFRYFLIRPLAWSQEVIQFLLGLLFLAGLPLATLRGDHIVVDVLSARLTGSVRLAAHLAAALMLTAYFLALSWYCGRFASKLMGYGDRTNWLGLPWHWIAWAGTCAFAAAAIASLYQAREPRR